LFLFFLAVNVMKFKSTLDYFIISITWWYI